MYEGGLWGGCAGWLERGRRELQSASLVETGHGAAKKLALSLRLDVGLLVHLVYSAQKTAATLGSCTTHSLTAVLAHSTRRLAAVDIDGALLLLLGLLGVDDALLDIAREAEEGLLDVDVGLGADFHEGNAELVRERLALLGRNRALLLPIALVADKDLVHALCRVLLDVGEPRADVCSDEYIG